MGIEFPAFPVFCTGIGFGQIDRDLKLVVKHGFLPPDSYSPQVNPARSFQNGWQRSFCFCTVTTAKMTLGYNNLWFYELQDRAAKGLGGTASSVYKLVAWGWVFWKRNHLITFDFNLTLPWPPLQDILKPESARKEPQAFHWHESRLFPVAGTETGQSPWLP